MCLRPSKPLRDPQPLRRQLGMDTISKVTIKAISNSQPKLLHMVIRPLHMLSKATHRRHTVSSLCTADTRMLSLLRVTSKDMDSKVSKGMLVTDSLKLDTLLQLVMGLPRLLLVVMITMLLPEVLLPLLPASRQRCLPLKAKGKR